MIVISFFDAHDGKPLKCVFKTGLLKKIYVSYKLNSQNKYFFRAEIIFGKRLFDIDDITLYDYVSYDACWMWVL